MIRRPAAHPEPTTLPSIHPTAIVDSQAQIASSVSIGPYCVVQGAVILGGDSKLIANVHLQGPLTIGRGNQIYPNACLGLSPQDRSFDPATDGPGTAIGDDNIFREGVTIHRATQDEPTRVGDRNYFMANSHAAHDCIIGNDCVLANGALLGGHVTVQDRAFLGGNSGVQQNVRIGRLAMISGSEGATRDVPPFCMLHHTRQVSSMNLIGLRRAGYQAHVGALKKAFGILYREGHTKAKAVELILNELSGDPLCKELAHFVQTSEHGISQYGNWKD